jgi:hypothetical protein
MADRRPVGNWLVRLALVLMIVSSTVRFGASPTTDVIARWILWVDVGVGGLGIAVVAAARWRRAHADDMPSVDDGRPDP